MRRAPRGGSQERSTRIAGRFRRYRTILVCGLLIAGAGFGYWWINGGRFNDDDVVFAIPLMERVSPDGAWKAYVDLIIHQNSGHRVLQAADRVYLMAMANPSDSAAVMLMTDLNEADDVFPRLEWITPEILRVTVANRSFVKVMRPEYRGVHVELRFDPDDPAARDAWLNSVKQPPAWPPDELK